MLGPIPIVAVAAVALPVAIGAGLLVALWRRRRGATRSEAWLDAALTGWILVVAVATLSPLQRLGTVEGTPAVVLTPFERMPGAPGAYAVVNLLLLVPLAVLLVLRGRRPRVLRAVAIGVAASLLIEVLQLLHPDRGTNVDDVILNSLGAAVAAVIAAVVRRAVAGAPTPVPPPGGSAPSGNEGTSSRGRGRLWHAGRRPPDGTG